jgi:site-specific DNA-methyltransferase (adenine-specific)
MTTCKHPAHPATGPGKRFKLPRGNGEICLISADCVERMSQLGEKSVSVVITSPPYNLGKAYRTYDDTIPREEYLVWTRRWAEAVARVLSVRGSFFLNIGGPPSDPWVAFDVLAAFRDLLVLQNVIHWVKSIAIDAPAGDVVTFGHYQPINATRYLNGCHEYIFHFTRKGTVPLDRLAVGVPYQDKSNVARWKSAGRDVHCRGNTWYIPYETIQSRDKDRPHPATFPAKLPEMCLKLHGLARVKLAMDPFLGLGSTAVACARLGIPFVGFDVDAGYVAEAARRVKKELAECRIS